MVFSLGSVVNREYFGRSELPASKAAMPPMPVRQTGLASFGFGTVRSHVRRLHLR